MSLFLPNIPQPADNLDFSQGQLLSNNQGLDTVFGVDHYKFSNATVSKGFHNTVTTPVFVATPPALPNTPPTTVANPVFYAFQQLNGAGASTTSLPVLQYSRAPSNAVPSPVTMIQSQASPLSLTVGSDTNILNFTGINIAYATLYYVSEAVILPSGPNIIRFGQSNIYWNGTNFISNFPTSGLSPNINGNSIELKNKSPSNDMINVYWTLQFYRIDT